MNFLPDSFLAWQPPGGRNNDNLGQEDDALKGLKSARHKEGLWNGLVYFQLYTPTAHQRRALVADSIRQLQLQLNHEVNSQFKELTELDDWHISMSKPFQLSHRYIDQFIKEMEKALSGFGTLSVRLDTDTVLFLPSEDVSSDDQRIFFAFPVMEETSNLETTNKLGRLVSLVDGVLQHFGLAPFFKPPLFHVSFASLSVGACASSNIQANLLKEQKTTLKYANNNNIIGIILEDIHFKIGDKLYRLSLK